MPEQLIPVKGTAAPSVSRMLGKAGLSNFSVQNLYGHVGVQTPYPGRMAAVLKKLNYQFEIKGTKPNVMFHIYGRYVT
ncbi:MAG: hypothetical protein E6R04_03700 [Spirochaetes bacterium]|nr:MAG: hypothetical protein E6R04_03700 [Spirochaetota bacterium]